MNKIIKCKDCKHYKSGYVYGNPVRYCTLKNEPVKENSVVCDFIKEEKQKEDTNNERV